MIDLQIRTATPADAPALGALVQRAIRTSNSADYAPAIIEADVRELRARTRCWSEWPCATCSPRSMTAASSAPSASACRRSQALFPVHRAARPAQRRSASVLFAISSSMPPALGCTSLQLSASITARPFYERLGYETHHVRGAHQRRFDLADAEGPAGLKSALRGPILPRPPGRFSNPRNFPCPARRTPAKQGIRSWRPTNCCFCPATASAPR